MKQLRFIASAIATVLLLSGCSLSAPKAVFNQDRSMNDYNYVYIVPTNNYSDFQDPRNVDGMIMNLGNFINPGDIIAGIMMQHGYVCVPEIIPANARRTMVATFADGGRTDLGVTLSTTATIQFTDAVTQAPVATFSAEARGQSNTEVIRNAITRALSNLPERQ